MESVSRWRLRLVAFEVRICRLNACPRLNLPDAVFLKRLAAPLCVFNLGIIVSLLQHKHTCPASAGHAQDSVVREDRGASRPARLFPSALLCRCSPVVAAAP